MNSRAWRHPSSQTILWLTAGLGYWALASLLHLRVSLFLIAPSALLPGRARPADYIFRICAILGALLCAWIIYRFLKRRTGHQSLVSAALWIAAVLAANRFLVSTTNEYVHYPQYALTALFLYRALEAGGRAPVFRILFWCTLMGIIDEAVQYFYLCPSYGEYLDFNDFLLNQLGASAGIIIAKVWGEPGPSATPRPAFFGLPEAIAAVLLLLGLGGGVLAGSLHISPLEPIPPGMAVRSDRGFSVFMERRPGVMGSWQQRQDGGAYYVLTPLQGSALMACVMAAGVLLDLTPFRRRVV